MSVVLQGTEVKMKILFILLRHDVVGFMYGCYLDRTLLLLAAASSEVVPELSTCKFNRFF